MYLHRKRLLATVVLLLLSPALCRADGLGDLRHDTRQDTYNGPTKSDSDQHDRAEDDSESYDWADDIDSEDTSFLALLAGMTATSPFWGPHVLLQDDFSDQSRFLSYPYKRQWEGNMLIDDDSHFSKWWQLRASAEYAHDFDRLSRTGGQILFDTAWRLGLDTSIDHRQEKLSRFEEDNLWTGDTNLVFRFAQNEWMQMRSGAGINWLADGDDTNLGFNFTYGADLMPVNPLVFSSKIDWGRLGQTSLFHSHTTVGVEFHHVELYTGFDYYDVGNTQIHGWLLGTRLWF